MYKRHERNKSTLGDCIINEMFKPATSDGLCMRHVEEHLYCPRHSRTLLCIFSTALYLQALHSWPTKMDRV